jgi:hypothetical protein
MNWKTTSARYSWRNYKKYFCLEKIGVRVGFYDDRLDISESVTGRSIEMKNDVLAFQDFMCHLWTDKLED